MTGVELPAAPYGLRGARPCAAALCTLAVFLFLDGAKLRIRLMPRLSRDLDPNLPRGDRTNDHLIKSWPRIHQPYDVSQQWLYAALPMASVTAHWCVEICTTGRTPQQARLPPAVMRLNVLERISGETRKFTWPSSCRAKLPFYRKCAGRLWPSYRIVLRPASISPPWPSKDDALSGSG